MRAAVPEYEAAIFEDLGWLGLDWERPVRRQSEHLGEHAAALRRLDAMGLVYPSFESRAEIARLIAARDRDGSWPRDPDGVPLYPGDANTLTLADAAAASRRASPTRRVSTWRRHADRKPAFDL